MGQNTAKDMEGIENESTKANREIAFTGEISSTKEIRLKKLPMDENNQFDNVNIGRQLKDKTTSNTFLFGHIHHGGFAVKSAIKLGQPTMPDDYRAQLKDSQGNYRSSPAIIGFPGGFSIYGTGSSHSSGGSMSDAQPPAERLSNSAYKKSKR